MATNVFGQALFPNMSLSKILVKLRLVDFSTLPMDGYNGQILRVPDRTFSLLSK
jgi:hypothetical protein